MKQQLTLKCMCGADVRMEILPPQIINTPRVSMALIEHPDFVACVTCGTLCAVTVQVLQGMLLGTMPAPPAASPLVNAASGMLPRPS